MWKNYNPFCHIKPFLSPWAESKGLFLILNIALFNPSILLTTVLSLVPRQGTYFLVCRKESRQRFALKGDFDSPFELLGLRFIQNVFQTWLRQLKNNSLINQNAFSNNSIPLNDKGGALDPSRPLSLSYQLITHYLSLTNNRKTVQLTYDRWTL